MDDTKSESSRRALPITEKTKEYLRELLRKQAEERAFMAEDYCDSGYVCRWPDGRPINPEYVSRHFEKVLAKHEMPLIRFHDIRHSVATALHAGGNDLKDIQGWLGHAELSTTADIYAHLLYSSKLRMAESMDAVPCHTSA